MAVTANCPPVFPVEVEFISGMDLVGCVPWTSWGGLVLVCPAAPSRLPGYSLFFLCRVPSAGSCHHGGREVWGLETVCPHNHSVDPLPGPGDPRCRGAASPAVSAGRGSSFLTFHVTGRLRRRKGLVEADLLLVLQRIM